MLKDIKTGLTLWRDTTNLRYITAIFILFLAAGSMAAWFVAPRLSVRIKLVSVSVGIGEHILVWGLTLLYLVAFGATVKRVAQETYGRNKYLLYQLAVSKRAGYICAMLWQLKWYGYGLVLLLAICDRAIVSVWFQALAYTLLFIMVFGIFYSSADMGDQKRKPSVRNGRIWISKNREWELFKITICRLYRCANLTVCKVLLILFIIGCGRAQVLYGAVFLAANAFLILLGDGYWRNESRNFAYFSNVGIPLAHYLRIHFAAGICFNIIIPLLLFYGMTGDLVVTAVSFILLSYLVVFWYLAQIYLHLFIGRDGGMLAVLCETCFVILAALPPAALLAAVWLYKKIAYKWREEGCSQ